MLAQPAVHVHTLLRADFKAQLPTSAKDDARMTLNSIYSLLFELPAELRGLSIAKLRDEVRGGQRAPPL